MAIHRLARPLRRSALSSGFFTSHQPSATLNNYASTSQRALSFSAKSGAPSSSSSSGSQGARGSRAKVVASSSQPRSASPQPTRKQQQTSLAQSAQLSKQSSTPWASELPHAGPALVCFDGFFSLHRPLLELPVRFRSRKLTQPIKAAAMHSPLDLDHAPEHEVLQAFETLDVSGESGTEEFVQVVDLAEDGTMGTPYMASIGPATGVANAEDALRDMDATAESLMAEDAQFEAELALEQLEEAQGDELRFESPYDAHLIGEPDGFQLGSDVARYIAENQPFVRPAAPAPSAVAPTATAAAPATDARTSSALAFLRPFSQAPKQTRLSPLLTTPPMSASESQLQVDKFLAGAQMHHSMAAHRDAIDFVHEPLALAANYYNAPLATEEALPVRGAFDGPRQRGEVRVWSEAKGWQVVDFSSVGSNAGSPFLPAEMIDLDWYDEVMMDSTKRKRKRAIKKHKFKKRRKAQKALRQRLGK